MERCVESTIEDAEGAPGAVVDEAGHGVAVHRAPRESAQHEHVQGALQDVQFPVGHATIINTNVDSIKC
jgi:hypothetical protein